MSKYKKACPAVGAARQADREKHLESGNSHVNSTTWSGPVSRFLMRGQENAIPLRDLKSLIGTSGRSIRQMIERERRNGTPILSDCQKGYFLPLDTMERDAFVRSMLHRAGEIEKTARAVEGGTVH